MYIGSLGDRKCEGYLALKDTSCGIKLVSATNSAQTGSKKIIIFVFFGMVFSFGELAPAKSVPTELCSEQTYTERVIQKLEGGDLGKASSPGARARSDARKAAASTSVHAFTSPASHGSQPEAGKKLAKELKPNSGTGTGTGNGLFSGRTSSRARPNPHNPGCGGGPRSVTVLDQAKKLEQEKNYHSIPTRDGADAKLTEKSNRHFTSKHAHEVGIDDRLPANPNQKSTKYAQVRSRVNKENNEKVRNVLEDVLNDKDSTIYPDVSVRGISSRVFHSEKYGTGDSGLIVAIHNEGPHKDHIMKAHSSSEQQIQNIEQKNILD